MHFRSMSGTVGDCRLDAHLAFTGVNQDSRIAIKVRMADFKNEYRNILSPPISDFIKGARLGTDRFFN